MHALSRVYSNFISLYLCVCKDDNVKWWVIIFIGTIALKEKIKYTCIHIPLYIY